MRFERGAGQTAPNASLDWPFILPALYSTQPFRFKPGVVKKAAQFQSGILRYHKDVGHCCVHKFLCLIPICLVLVPASFAQNERPATAPESSLVQRALGQELRCANDLSHPMRYVLRKSSPRLTTTKEMVETRDGSVARLVLVNDQPLSPADAAKEQARIQELLADPGKQRHRKQVQDEDTGRALKVLRNLPLAFLYHDAGPISTPAGTAERFTFLPNPKFNPPDLETQVLTALEGEIWIDPVHVRVLHLEGHLTQDVDFGWGILGRLYKGGWITIDQADVGSDVWRIVRFRMSMSGRVVIKTRKFETTEEETQFAPVPLGLDYRQGIAMLRANGNGNVSGISARH